MVVRIFFHNFADETIKRDKMSIAIKNRTRGEVIAAFRESIRRKNECVQSMKMLMREIRREEQAQLAN
ncbi:MAG: hypothetical protein II509_02110 [Prevotella sp.]|nr:hypothetical protein [Prevotella sp.]